MSASLLDRLDVEDRTLLLECGELSAGTGGDAYLVGGRVRDLLLELPSDDLDLVVVGDGLAAAQAVARKRGGSLTRYHAFQTARVDLRDGRKLDFATARSEVYGRPGALPDVAAGALEEDLGRRDFTINTLALSLRPSDAGQLIDPFGGAEDLTAGRIRILHERSFADDPTRLMRAVRFATRFGYQLDQPTQRAFDAAVEGRYLDDISGDRLRRELMKLFGEAPVDGPRALADAGLLALLHRDLAADPARLTPVGTASDLAGVPVETRWSVVLAVLAARVAPQDRQVLARRLRLSREDRRGLVDAGAPWTDAREIVQQAVAASEVAAALDSLAPEALAAVLAISTEDDALAGRLRRYLSTDRDTSTSLDGAALMELGFPPGPGLGEALRRLRAARIDGAIESEAEERAMALEILADAPN